MGVWRDESGQEFEIDDAYARSMGYAPVSTDERAAQAAAEGIANRGAATGALGAARAGASAFASGVTLGGTDWLLSKYLTPLEREQLAAERAAHPYISGASEVLGAVAPALLTGGTSAVAEGAVEAGGLAARGLRAAAGVTPTGYLAGLTGRAVEKGVASGIAGTIGAAGAMGVEGALQAGGQYIGHVALENKEATAEGLYGALGTGFAFGAGGGGAALGVTKGTMAARKMFARTMAGKDAVKTAESTWTLAKQAALDGDTATAATAEARLNDMRTAKTVAERELQSRAARTAEENLNASAAPRMPKKGIEKPNSGIVDEAVGPEPLIDIAPSQGGMPTSVFKRPEEITFDSSAARAFDERLPTLDEGPSPLADVRAQEGAGGVTSVFKRPAAVEAPVVHEPGSLEARVAAAEAENAKYPRAPLETKKPSGHDNPQVRGWRDEELAARKRAEANAPRDLGERMAADVTNPRATDLETRLQMMKAQADQGVSLAGMREANTEALLGKAVAKEETVLTNAFDEWSAAKKDIDDLFDHGDIDTSDFGKSRAVLDKAHDAALERVQYAASPQEAGQALHEADALERMLEKMHSPSLQQHGASPVPLDFAADIHTAATKIDRYEKAQARLVEAVGDGAHPASQASAKAYGQASDDAVRKATERTTRAVEDHETFGPAYASPKERVQYARERQNEAKNAFVEARNAHVDAKYDFQQAAKTKAAGEAEKAKALKVDAKAAKAAARSGTGGKGLGKVGVLGGALEILDIPGLPKISDLPVVGPLLGAYLKYRTVKAAFNRVGGRVPALADNRVAALAARTQDRIAGAIDRSLGLADRTSRSAPRVAPIVGGILAAKIYDDGGPPPKGTGVQELAAVRIREIAAYVTTPGAIEKDVRRELRDVTDPDIIVAAEAHRRTAMEYLLSVAPKMPSPGILQKQTWLPSPALAMSFGRALEAVNDPAGVFSKIATERAQISLEAARTMQAVYPQLLAMGQQRVLERSAEIKQNVPMRQRVQMSLFYQLPLDAGLEADNLMITQGAFERKPIAPPAAMPAAPMSALAAPTTLNALYQPPSDSQRHQ